MDSPLDAEHQAHHDATEAIRALKITQRHMESYRAGLAGDTVHLRRLEHDLEYFTGLLNRARAAVAGALPASTP